MSVQTFVNSFFLYLPVKLLLLYFSPLFHSGDIVSAGQWNQQCWNDLCDEDYHPILSPVALFSILCHVSIPIQQLLNTKYDIHPETCWAAFLHSCHRCLVCIFTLYAGIVHKSEQLIWGNFELPRYILGGDSQLLIPCRIFLLYFSMFLSIVNCYTITNAIPHLKFCYHVLFILISNPF
jgi:hypothetical protein